MERYQNKFGFDKRQAQNDPEVVSLAQAAPIIEVTLDQVTAPSQSEETVSQKRIHKVHGARGAHIANTLLTDAEYIHYFLLWAMVAGVIIGAVRAMNSAAEVKVDSKGATYENHIIVPESTAYDKLAAGRSSP